jgi:hypothetical protein
MRRLLYTGVVVGAILALSLLAGRSGRTTATAADSPTAGLSLLQQRLASGTVSVTLDELRQPARSEQRGPSSARGAANDRGCRAGRRSNVRVNQDCQNLTDTDLAGRGQAQNETAVASDPQNPSNLVASSNDYRRGDSGCITYYSGDGGRNWQDSTPPMAFTRGDAFGGVARHYWQAGGDTSVAWDTKGNAYLSCLMFMRGRAVTGNPDASSGLYVFRSTAGRGATWNFPARPVAELDDAAGTGTAMLDKQYMTVDNHDGSPFQDRVYVTWTFFAPDATAYIYGAHSADYGEHFSEPKLVSADSPACAQTLGVPTPQGRCNANQYSQPFTGPDGALYVVWNNANATDFSSSADNRSQVLLARSNDGGDTFSAPVKVADYYELPDCVTYQAKSAGSACVPEKGATSNSFFRAANYPSGAVNPVDADAIVVSFGSYVNGRSNEGNGCVPRGFNADTLLARYDGVKAPGACNNDILTSVSRNAGKTFTGEDADVRAADRAGG